MQRNSSASRMRVCAQPPKQTKINDKVKYAYLPDELEGIRVLGEGSYGMVYEALHKPTG
jgi:hypothetical protein